MSKTENGSSKKKTLLLAGAVVIALVASAGLYTTLMEEEVALPPSSEVQQPADIPVAEQPTDAQAVATDGNATPVDAGAAAVSAPIDMDSAAASAGAVTTIVSGAEAGYSGGVVSKERADQILSAYSKKAAAEAEAKTKKESDAAKAKNPDAALLSMGYQSGGKGSRAVLPRNGQAMIMPEGAGVMPVFNTAGGFSGGAGATAPSAPAFQEVKLNGILCEKGECFGMSDRGIIKAGGTIGTEKVISVTKQGIKTDLRFINY